MTTLRSSPPEATVDFNSVDANGIIRLSRTRLIGLEPTVGEPLQLRDPEGNACQAVVVEADETALLASLVWERWQTASEPPRVHAATGDSLREGYATASGSWYRVTVGRRQNASASATTAPVHP